MRPILTLHRFLSARLFYPCVASSVLAVMLLAVRRSLGEEGVNFLVWNLYLAWLPYLASLWAAWRSGRGVWRPLALLPVGAFWLLFLPNAPYLMTDLVHLHHMEFVWWYNIGMLLAFAWAGCLLGVASLAVVQELVQARLGTIAGWTVVLAGAGLSGVGVYMGRFLRWNSWDLLVRPYDLTSSMLNLLADPAAYPRLVGVSGLVACIMLLGYGTLQAARRSA